jgi:hypothetical protein
MKLTFVDLLESNIAAHKPDKFEEAEPQTSPEISFG